MFLILEFYLILVVDYDVVPNVYPVDLFEHIWVVDRLQRLGISRYFDSEIKDFLDYIYRYFIYTIGVVSLNLFYAGKIIVCD